jgi:phage gpG-like protein
VIELHATVNGEDRPILLAVDELPEAFEEARKRFGGYLRAEMKRRIDGQNFAPLDPETERRKTRAILVAALTRQGERRGRSAADNFLRRYDAMMRYSAKANKLLSEGDQDKSARAQLQAIVIGRELRQAARQFEAAGITGTDAILAFARANAARRQERGLALKMARAMPLQEGESRERFTYRNRSGEIKMASRIANASKERRRLLSRGKRAYSMGGTEHVGKVLGNLRQSARIKLEGDNRLVVSSAPRWSGVHNDGGPAGNQAQIPKREFLSLQSQDLDVFVEILQEHMIEAILNG